MGPCSQCRYGQGHPLPHDPGIHIVPKMSTPLVELMTLYQYDQNSVNTRTPLHLCTRIYDYRQTSLVIYVSKSSHQILNPIHSKLLNHIKTRRHQQLVIARRRRNIRQFKVTIGQCMLALLRAMTSTGNLTFNNPPLICHLSTLTWCAQFAPKSLEWVRYRTTEVTIRLA